jgi:hypothetical protein
MMEVAITVVVGVIGCVIAVLTYFAGLKKNSNFDVEKRAHFEGTIEAKLDQLIKTVDKLDQKLTRNTSELYTEIDQKIEQHEKRYHHNGD